MNTSTSTGGSGTEAHRHERDSGTARDKSVEEIQDVYADLASKFARWEPLERAVAGRYRHAQFGRASGRVLDVACGTGSNFRYLDDADEVIGIDLTPAMLAEARDSLDAVDVDGSLLQMDAQRLAFPDDSFDTVISAMSTCTFPDPVAALQEMERVCKPGGRILLFEHGRSDVGAIARFQDWRADAHYEKTGCRWNQEPLTLVREAGIAVEDARTAVLGIFTMVDATPE